MDKSRGHPAGAQASRGHAVKRGHREKLVRRAGGGSRKETELEWPVTSMQDIVSGPGGSLGLSLSPPTPALSSEPVENQQEMDEEPGTVSVSLMHRTPKRQCRASGTAELEDVA